MYERPALSSDLRSAQPEAGAERFALVNPQVVRRRRSLSAEMSYAYRHFNGPDGRVYGINEQR
jgi:hypothetical protein